jgi:spermidine/putrescine ABC transporter ATP-binding subunit
MALGISSGESLGHKGASITLEKLTKFYGEVAAVQEIFLDIHAGEFLTLLGPSGSGKTTTLMMIAGFTIPTAGDIRIDGRSIVTIPPHKRNIGMVFQHYALFPHMSIFHNIAFPLQMRRLPKAEIAQRVRWALDLVQLPGVEKRRPKQLSGGQQQRIALARALVFDPSVLLLDEPLGALDRKLREGMQIELKQLHHKVGTTIIYVTHDQEEALTLSDRIVVFNDGRIVQAGTPDDLYRYPANRFVAGFIGETNFFTGRVVSLEGKSCSIQMQDGVQVTGCLRDSFPTPKTWATFSLRPEKILLGEEAAHTTNSYQGTVEEFLYLGEVTKYRIRLGTATTVTAKWPNRLGRARVHPGSTIAVGWNQEEMLLVALETPPEGVSR